MSREHPDLERMLRDRTTVQEAFVKFLAGLGIARIGVAGVSSSSVGSRTELRTA